MISHVTDYAASSHACSKNFMYVSVSLKYVIMINNVLRQRHKKWQYYGKLAQTGLQGGAVVGTVSSQGVCSQILSSWRLG